MKEERIEMVTWMAALVFVLGVGVAALSGCASEPLTDEGASQAVVTKEAMDGGTGSLAAAADVSDASDGTSASDAGEGFYVSYLGDAGAYTSMWIQLTASSGQVPSVCDVGTSLVAWQCGGNKGYGCISSSSTTPPCQVPFGTTRAPAGCAVNVGDCEYSAL